MPAITFVSLEIQKGGNSTLPTDWRWVRITYNIAFTQAEVAGRVTFTESIRLFGWDNGRVNESKLLADYSQSGRIVTAQSMFQTETFSAWIQRGQLDEDRDRVNPCCCVVTPDCDEIVARVCLNPIVTCGCCLDSPVLVGSWGAGGCD